MDKVDTYFPLKIRTGAEKMKYLGNVHKVVPNAALDSASYL